MRNLSGWVEILAHHFGALISIFHNVPHGFAGLLETSFVSIWGSNQKSFVFEVFDEPRSSLSITI
jgi:hypothetical protein